jgi:hypothetical protein
MTKRWIPAAALALGLALSLAGSAALAETVNLKAGEHHTFRFDPAADIRYQVNSLGQPSSGWLQITFASDDQGMSLQEIKRYSLDGGGQLGYDSRNVVALQVGVDNGSVSAEAHPR